MRSPGYPFVVAVLFAAAVPLAQTPKPDPGAVLAAARTALGGEAKLSAVKTIVATGRTRQVRGDNLVPIDHAGDLQSTYSTRALHGTGSL